MEGLRIIVDMTIQNGKAQMLPLPLPNHHSPQGTTQRQKEAENIKHSANITVDAIVNIA